MTEQQIALLISKVSNMIMCADYISVILILNSIAFVSLKRFCINSRRTLGSRELLHTRYIIDISHRINARFLLANVVLQAYRNSRIVLPENISEKCNH